MTQPPASPKIYHITHLDNLAPIAESGLLWSDAKRLELALDCQVVGMSSIKRRRLEELPVPCHPGTKVGDYVPFYFCPRSIMLYILHMGNHPELTYQGGQSPIVHLQADLMATMGWAEETGVRWAFSDRNAGTRLAGFYRRVEDLEKVNWIAVAATDFRDMLVKEGKQAEFLVFGSFPWELVERIGVLAPNTKERADALLEGAAHHPPVRVERQWYY